MKTQISIALRFLFVMTILTGIVYPLVMTGIAQLTFPSKANGSLMMKDGKLIGSSLLAQKSDSNIYFLSRPSAIDYNAVPSGGSNFGPTSKSLQKQVNDRRLLFATKNAISDTLSIPKEMIFASGSGLDPHISAKAAYMQVDRIVKARKFTKDQRQQLIHCIISQTKSPQLLFLGEERVNVFLLNLDTDKL